MSKAGQITYGLPKLWILSYSPGIWQVLKFLGTAEIDLHLIGSANSSNTKIQSTWQLFFPYSEPVISLSYLLTFGAFIPHLHHYLQTWISLFLLTNFLNTLSHSSASASQWNLYLYGELSTAPVINRERPQNIGCIFKSFCQ